MISEIVSVQLSYRGEFYETRGSCSATYCELWLVHDASGFFGFVADAVGGLGG